MYDNYDFETIQEKEDYIESNSAVTTSEEGQEQRHFYCPDCDKEYVSIEDTIRCCIWDCREQAEEMARDRNIYEATEQ